MRKRVEKIKGRGDVKKSENERSSGWGEKEKYGEKKY
jgi:hypothetical protein